MNRALGILMLVLLPHAAGCTSLKQSFPGHAPEEVWTAALAVAEAPEYDDWVMSGNDVWIEPGANRIEIERRLKRYLHRPGAEPLYQERNFRFTVTLHRLEPPTIKFTSRGLNIPMHARLEADRYFHDMQHVLAGEAPPTEVAPPAPAPAPAPPPPGDLERIGPEDVGRPGDG